MSDENVRMERQNARIQQVKRQKMFLAAGVGVVLLVALIVAVFFMRKPRIVLRVDSVTMMQDEKVPKFKVDVAARGNEKKILDKKDDYTVKKFVSELKAGKNYEVSCKADGKTDGKFKIQIKLSKDMKKKLEKDWSRKMKFTVEQGTLTVKNKYGAWDGEKFKKTNGKYAKNEFIPFEREKYYFGKDGKLKSEKFYVDPEKPMLALTFDDGPGADTDRLLSVLEENNARATFFMVGTRVPQHPETIKRMKEIGCELGNHTAEHKNLKKLSDAEIKEAIQSVSDQVAEATGGSPTTVTRPPYGAFDDHVKAAASSPLIMWSVDTLDWKTKNVESTIKSVNSATDGDIILMHDIHKTSVEAAIKVIPQLVEKGYQLVTVSEMAEARGVKLEDGGVYFSFYKQ